MENKDFKYILQDITKIFLGKELTYGDLLTYEDIPFKLKAITNNYFLKDAEREEKMTEHFVRMTADEFSYQIYEQLKLRLRVNHLENKSSLFGKKQMKHVSVECGFKEFMSKYRHEVLEGNAYIEEIIISKLALMAIGC